MSNLKKLAVSVSVIAFALVLTAAPTAIAGVNDLSGSLNTGEIQKDGEQGQKAAAEADKKGEKSDDALIEKLKKLLAEIKKEDPNVDSLPVELKQPITAATDEAGLKKFALRKRHERYVVMFKKAHDEFEGGKYEVSFASFKRIYREFNHNRKALCFMVLCKSMQKKYQDAVDLAEELLDLIMSAKEIAAMNEALKKDLAAWDLASTEVKLDKKKLAELNAKLEKTLKTVNKLCPRIANIPKKLVKPDMDGNLINNIIKTIGFNESSLRLKNMHEAEKLFESGQYEKAFDAFEAVVKQNPASVRSLYYMALCKMRLGRPDQALAITTKLTEIIKDRHEIRESRMDVNDELGIKDRNEDGKVDKKDKEEKENNNKKDDKKDTGARG